MLNQTPEEFVLVEKEDKNPNRAAKRLSLFYEDGSPVALPLASSVPSRLGKNEIGASWRPFTQHRYLCRSITVPGPGVILNVEAHIKGSASAVSSLAARLHADEAGDVGNMLSFAGLPAENGVYIANNYAGWIGFAMGTYVTEGTYWVGFGGSDTNMVDISIAYDADGSGLHVTEGGAWLSANPPAGVAHSDDLSIRTLFLPA